MRPTVLILFLALSHPALAEDPPSYHPDEDGYRRIAAPFLKEHCLSCHGPRKQKGKFRIDQDLPNTFDAILATEKWGEVLDTVNSHEMPPEDEPQPSPEDASRFAEWVAAELSRAEVSRRPPRVVLRRLNRSEYAHTVRDLLGVDFDPEQFPADPPSGGFDNIGAALTISPLHLELYYDAARDLVSRAIVRGEQPPAIKWRFEPEESTAGPDRTRVERAKNRILLNSGRNQYLDGFTVVRTDGWDRTVGFRDFVLEHPGQYILRIHAASRVPTRDQVVASVRPFLTERENKEARKRGGPPKPERVEEELDHFRTESMYDYGPARLRIEVQLGGQPSFEHTLDLDTTYPAARTFEVRIPFDTQRAGVTLKYAYDLPRVLENFWLQGNDQFARPEALIDWVELEGPIHQQWPPASHTKLFAALPSDAPWGSEQARAVLTRFMPRAWRRPVSDQEIASKLALFEDALASGADFLDAIQAPLVAVLTSPRFLYLTEPSNDPRPLDDHELATRLSYFLWSSMPDDVLTRAAASGQVSNPNTLRRQVDRLLRDPRSAAFSENFASQWLELRRIGTNPPAPDLFPRYDRHLEESIAAESIAFFREILDHDLSVLNFIRSDFVTINERLARFYGIPGVRGDQVRKVPVPPDTKRGGIVTQASILSVTSNGTRTSPVVRGTWILKNLLGTDPGLPVANAGEIAPKVPGIDKATVRQRLEIHRTLAQCARCHNKIDPLGFALENFNAAGEWRDQEGFGYKGRIGRNDPDIDASAKLPDGTEFVGVSGLQEVLLEREDLFLRCLTEKLFTYALGRELGYSDRAHLDGAVAHLKNNGRTLRSLIHFIVTSDPFLTK